MDFIHVTSQWVSEKKESGEQRWGAIKLALSRRSDSEKKHLKVRVHLLLIKSIFFLSH